MILYLEWVQTVCLVLIALAQIKIKTATGQKDYKHGRNRDE